MYDLEDLTPTLDKAAGAAGKLVLANKKAEDSYLRLASVAEGGADGIRKLTSDFSNLDRRFSETAKSIDPMHRSTLKLGEGLRSATVQTRGLTLEALKYQDVVRQAAPQFAAVSAQQDALVKSSEAMGQAALFSAGELGKLAGVLSGVFLGFLTGEGAIEALVSGAASIVEVFATAAIGAGGLQAAMAALTAQAGPLLAVFGPWIAGLAAVGAAVFFLNKRHEEHKQRIDDLNKSIGEMGSQLAQTYPSLNGLANQTDLAAQGSANFAAWLRRKSEGMADYAKNTRAATLDLINQQVIEAKANAEKLRAENIRVNTRGVKTYIGPGDGPFGLIGGVNSKAYKKYLADQAKADQVLAHAQAVFDEAVKAPDSAFVRQAENARKATAAVKAHTEAIKADAVAVVSLADGVPAFRAALAEEVESMGRTEEAKRRLTAERMASLATTQEEADEIRRLEQARRDQNRVMQEAEAIQKVVNTQQGETIKTFNDAVGSTIRFSSKIEILAADFETAVRQAADMRNAVEGVGAAIKNNDWTGAFGGLLNVLDRVKKAFGENALASEKLAAVSGLGQGVGSVIGGKVGASVSGAANGLQAGAQLASTLGVTGPWGAALGAALGGVAGLLGDASARAQAKVDAIFKAQQDLQAKQMESSDSLRRSLDIAGTYQNSDLEYSNAILVALRSIDSQITSFANAVSRSVGASDLLDTSGLGIGTVGSGGLFGSKTKTELVDQGLVFDPSTYGAIVTSGVTGNTYADLVSTKTKKFLGFTTSAKVTSSTVTGAIGGDLLDQVTDIIRALGDSVVSAAKAFGDDATEAARAALKSVNIDLGKLSLKDLKPDEMEAAINALFARVGDQLAASGVPGLEELAKVGEGAFETLTRLATEYKAIDTALASIGMTFRTVGVESLGARDGLVKLFGGLDAFTSQTAFFAEHFLTEEERLKPVKDAVAGRLAELKLPANLDREGFKNLVLKQDVSTEDGAKMYAALMALAPAFDKVATAAESAKAAVEDKAQSLQDQLDDLILSPAQKLAKSRALEMEAVKKLDASLVPFLQTLWKAQDAAEAAKLATDRSNMYADLLDAQGRTEEAKALKRSLALAAIEDPIQKQYQQQIWAAEDAAAKVAEARNVLTEAYNRERDAIQATKDKFAELSKSLRGFSASLSATIAGSDLAGRYRSTRQAFLATAAMARLGDPDAMGRLQSEGEAFTAASRDYVATSQDYLRDVGLVRSAVDEAADTADRQALIAEQQLDALNKSVEGLMQINTSVISVRDAIAGLRAANQAAAAAGVVSVGGQPVPGATSTSTTTTTTTPSLSDAQKALNNASFFWGLVNSEMGRYDTGVETEATRYAKETAARYNPGYMDIVSAYGIEKANALVEAGQLSYFQSGSLKYATGGSFEVGGSGPPDSKLFSLALSPGEAVNVRRSGDSGDQNVVNELRRLREELVDLRATNARIATSNDKMERTLTNVTEGGRAMQTQAAA